MTLSERSIAPPTPFWRDPRPPAVRSEADSVSALQKASVRLAGELKQYVGLHFQRVELIVRSAGSSSGLEASKAIVSLYDGIMSTLFLGAMSVVGLDSARTRLALGAVGSYGRCAMSLASDLDIRILFVDPEEEKDARRIADAILYPLWDMHIPVGHQVTPCSELIQLARTDLCTATTLLDWRHLLGDRRTWNAVVERSNAGLFSTANASALAARLEQDTAARHERFGGSVYLLEPDVKLGPGGLRDLDIILWISRARWKVSRLEDLSKLGVLVPREVSDILEAREHLWRVRNQLHMQAARRTDRLTFDEQERLAEVFGYGTGSEAVERFMSVHYKHASAVIRARESVSERAIDIPRARRPSEKTIGEGLKVFDNQLSFLSTAILVQKPALALRIYYEAVHRSLSIHSESRKAIRRAVQSPSFCQSIYSSGECRSLFLSLCTAVQNTRLKRDSVLGDLHDVGLLTALVPEFLPLVGRVHHDAYHVYTVDMHSIAAMDRLRALARGDLASLFPLACRVAAESVRPHILFLATLLHDIGKAVVRHSHAEAGVEIAKTIALRLGMSESAATDVGLLVRHHLLLYHAATRRDVDDPAVMDEVLTAAGGRERLRELYLLTFVDVSTTNPDAMNQWKGGLLDALFVSADMRMRGEWGSIAEQVRNTKERLEDACARKGLSPGLCAFVDGMPERYVLGTAPDRILQHAQVLAERVPEQPKLAILSTASGASAELCVVADDRPGLLASIAAVLVANRFAVLEAQIYSRPRPGQTAEAIDLFFVRAAGELGQDELQRLALKAQRDLADVLAGELSAEEIVRPRIFARRTERWTPAVGTQITIDNRASAGLTVIEVFTRDRPGLLYVLASTFRRLGLSIQIAKINTEGTRIADVFYVCESDGSKIESAERIDEVRCRIDRALELLASEGS